MCFGVGIEAIFLEHVALCFFAFSNISINSVHKLHVENVVALARHFYQ